LSFFITAGQISDATGAPALIDDLPKAQWLLATRYDLCPTIFISAQALVATVPFCF